MVNMLGLEPIMPAYGRDYKSLAKLKADFEAGLDFQTASGSYTNKRDLFEFGVRQITVRYGKLRKVGSLKVDSDGQS